MKILGLCGSLRDHSSNAFLLKAAKDELKDHEWLAYDLTQLPYFDPDNQYSDEVPKSVLEFRALGASADILFITTPEYAHGLPGILKNAFEWLFHEGTQQKPVYAVIGASQGEHTQSQLIEILKTMDFKITEQQTLIVKGARSFFSIDGKLLDTEGKENFLRFCESAVSS